MSMQQRRAIDTEAETRATPRRVIAPPGSNLVAISREEHRGTGARPHSPPFGAGSSSMPRPRTTPTPTHEEALADDLYFLTTAQVAERLQLSERTVKRMIQSGELPSRRIRSSRRIALSALARYLSSHAD